MFLVSRRGINFFLSAFDERRRALDRRIDDDDDDDFC